MEDEPIPLDGPAASAADPPNLPAAVDREAFQAELDRLRAREKAHTREGDAIAAARRRLPMVEVAADSPLIGPHGPVTLLDAPGSVGGLAGALATPRARDPDPGRGSPVAAIVGSARRSSHRAVAAPRSRVLGRSGSHGSGRSTPSGALPLTGAERAGGAGVTGLAGQHVPSPSAPNWGRANWLLQRVHHQRGGDLPCPEQRLNRLPVRPFRGCVEWPNLSVLRPCSAACHRQAFQLCAQRRQQIHAWS